jgi:hypothetical protein
VSIVSAIDPTGDLVRRIRAEYLEMPGLRLSAEQARRLWAVDERSCRAALAALVDARFLQRLYDGSYVRR